MSVKNEKYVEIIRNNIDKLEAIGFSIEEPDEYGNPFSIKFPKAQDYITIEQQLTNLANNKQILYRILGLEKGIAQRLGEETLAEQNDTIGKFSVQNEINEHIKQLKTKAESQEKV